MKRDAWTGFTHYGCRFGRIETVQLVQLWSPVWDGYLISKSARDALVDAKLAQRGFDGYNWLTRGGIGVVLEWAKALGLPDPLGYAGVDEALLEYMK